MPRRPSRTTRTVLRLAAATLALLALLPVAATPVAAEGSLTMTARALLQGHVRAGSWFAVAVDVANAGPTVTGELRITGGADSRTRFGTPAELATGSRKQYLLYALPPSFGGNMKVQLIAGDRIIVEAPVAIALHDQTQLVVGVVAENPAKIVGQLDLLPNQNAIPPVIVPLTPADLPERIQAWAPLDRLIWQDTDTASLTTAQLAALRTWIAGGGRLVIVGGTAGADILSALPDELLPYRPSAILDVDPASLRPILGGVPDGAATLTAYAGDRGAGHVLATSGDRVIAGDLTFGTGSVTLLGFDPTTGWIADGDAWDAPLWKKLLPQRSTGTVSLADDNQIVGAVSNLPSLALPPITGLLVLLFGYIVLVGPVNYLVLSRLDRREWAWVTVPALIGVFAVGALGIGSLLRGSDVIIHQVAIVRGAPGTDQATTQAYLGIFSPSRATFQLRVEGDALLASPMNGDIVGGGTGAGLDVLEGDPSRIRDLQVGFGSLRTIRAEGSATGPVVDASLRLEGGRITGTLTNRSPRTLESPALVLGGSAVKLDDIPAGATADVSFTIALNANVNGVPLSERVVGPMSFDGSSLSETEQRRLVRRSIIDQLSFDPLTGAQWALPGDSIQLLTWGTDAVLPAVIEGQVVRQVANVLYEVPLPFTIGGTTTFSGDLLRSSVVETDANFFARDPWSIQLGTGKARIAWRPLPFDGSFGASRVVVALSLNGETTMPGGNPVAATEKPRCDPATEGCVLPQDALPDLEVLDVATGAWVQLAHLAASRPYELSDAARWVNPTSGEVQVRFVNERPDPVYFQFLISIMGAVR
ncbi:MAG TPA: hypothetical protein VGK16_15340 [Candidatus Limnocylindrales bacterium]